MCGLLGTPATPRGRLLVTDDRALAFLERAGPDLPHIVHVFDTAPRCRDFLAGVGDRQRTASTAMFHRDLAALPAPAMADGLTVRTVRRGPADPADGVPLEQAAALAKRADPQLADEPLPVFVEFLRTVTGRTRLFTALDDRGVVRATSGANASGTDANAFFVNTDAGWRRHGVGTAMTAVALTWARAAGATQACLNASAAGASIYLRLGFEPVGVTHLFARSG